MLNHKNKILFYNFKIFKSLQKTHYLEGFQLVHMCATQTLLPLQDKAEHAVAASNQQTITFYTEVIMTDVLKRDLKS